MATKTPLYGLSPAELQDVVGQMQMPRFTASQIAEWMYKRGVRSIDAMTNLSKTNRQRIDESYELGLSEPVEQSCSADGTKKYLFGVANGNHIESVYIPDRERATLCISTQAGCRMGCAFCMTGRQGLAGNLTRGEILNQIASLPERNELSNVVLMGMGEPLDNLDNVLGALAVMTSDWGYAWSPTRITLSTAGVLPNLRRFMESTSVNLAVSLHNPFHDERMEIMPVEKAWPIEKVVEELRTYDFSHQRRVSFEYIVMSGLNDSDRHIRGLVKLLGGMRCRINLIRFHRIPDSPFFSPDTEAVLRFRDRLTQKGIMTTLRASRGEDIKAACGLLSTDKNRLSQNRNTQPPE